MSNLLSKADFREKVFARDKGKCVFCDNPAVDAHHLIERKLFKNSGYFLDNGVSVCADCHWKCERTDLSVEEGRAAAGIKNVIVPDEYDPSTSITKWGDVLMTNGYRFKGPMFETEQVQKVIVDHLYRYVSYGEGGAIIRYPRTPHISGSKLQDGDTTDGQVPIESLADGELYLEEKVDGANSGISFSDDLDLILQCRGHILNGGAREEQFNLFKSWAKYHEGTLFDVLGNRYIMFGEWCYAKHTIFYDRLPHYFFEFDIFDKVYGTFLGTPERHEMLKGSPIISVPVVHKGFVNTKEMRALVKPSLYKSEDWTKTLLTVAERLSLDPAQVLKQTNLSDKSEGLYLKHEKNGRVIGRYKFVRPDFIQAILDSGSHWNTRTIVPNQLADGVDIFGG